MRYSLRRPTVFIAAFAILLTLLAFFFRTIGDFQAGLVDEYAVEEVADMICTYWETHEAEFPQNWDDMKAVYKQTDAGYGLGPRGFSKLKEAVTVDFKLLARFADLRSEEAGELVDALFVRNANCKHGRDDKSLFPYEIYANRKIRSVIEMQINQMAIVPNEAPPPNPATDTPAP